MCVHNLLFTIWPDLLLCENIVATTSTMLCSFFGGSIVPAGAAPVVPVLLAPLSLGSLRLGDAAGAGSHGIPWICKGDPLALGSCEWKFGDVRGLTVGCGACTRVRCVIGVVLMDFARALPPLSSDAALNGGVFILFFVLCSLCLFSSFNNGKK